MFSSADKKRRLRLHVAHTGFSRIKGPFTNINTIGINVTKGSLNSGTPCTVPKKKI